PPAAPTRNSSGNAEMSWNAEMSGNTELTSVDPAGLGETGRGDAGQDRVIHSLLDPYAKLVDSPAARRLSLESPRSLWLVTGGALDLFAVAAEGDGDWTFVGRLEPGTLMPGSVPGPYHSLFGRLPPSCTLARLKVADLARVQRDAWAANR